MGKKIGWVCYRKTTTIKIVYLYSSSENSRILRQNCGCWIRLWKLTEREPLVRENTVKGKKQRNKWINVFITRRELNTGICMSKVCGAGVDVFYVLRAFHTSYTNTSSWNIARNIPSKIQANVECMHNTDSVTRNYNIYGI